MEEAPGPSGRGVPMTSRGPSGQDADTGGGGGSRCVYRMGRRRVAVVTIILAGMCCKSFRQEVNKTYKVNS